MSDDEIQKNFTKILIEQLGVHESLAEAPETRFLEELHFDSLDAVEVCVACEEEFMITIMDGEYDGIKTVAQALAFLKSKLEATWSPKK